MDFYNEVPSSEAVEETARRYCAETEEEPVAAEGRTVRRAKPASFGAARLLQEITDGMKETRAVFLALLRLRLPGKNRAFRLLITEKNRNIHIMEQAYGRLTGLSPLVREPGKPFNGGLCQGLRRAFLEQSAVIERIAGADRSISDPFLRSAIRAAGDSELKSLSEINRLYLHCR